MTEYGEWDETLSDALAAQIGLQLTDEHRQVIRFLRQDFTDKGETATLRPQGLVGVPDVPEFLQQIVGSGGHLWARRTSADMMQLEQDDLFDGVEAISRAAALIEKTDGAQLLFV